MSVQDVVAQPFVIARSDPQNGSIVELDAAEISFHFNKNLIFSTSFIPGFSFVEPRQEIRVKGVLQDVDEQNRPRIARFTVDHRSRTDFSWVVYGIERAGGEFLAEPFVLNYTTAPEPGMRTVSGSFAPASAPLLQPAELMDRLAVASFRRIEARPAGEELVAGKRMVSEPLHPETSLSTNDELSRTFVVMLAEYSTSPDSWIVRGAAQTSADGTFAFNTLREETLHPIAIRFRKNDNHTIEAFGIHDPRDRGVATAIDLSVGDGPQLVMRMYPFATSTSSSAFARAGRAVGDDLWAGTSIQELSSIRVDPETGRASTWSVGYLDDHDQYQTLSLDPLSARFTVPGIPPPRIGHFDPADLLDSQEIMAMAEQSGGSDFRADHPDAIARMRLGGSGETIRPDRELFWAVTYAAPAGAHRTFHIDPYDGSLLGLVDTGIDSGPNSDRRGITALFPNPASTHATLYVSIDPFERAALQVFDMLGRTVHEEELEPQSTEIFLSTSLLPSGTYLVRVRQGAATSQTVMTVLR